MQAHLLPHLSKHIDTTVLQQAQLTQCQTLSRTSYLTSRLQHSAQHVRRDEGRLMVSAPLLSPIYDHVTEPPLADHDKADHEMPVNATNIPAISTASEQTRARKPIYQVSSTNDSIEYPPQSRPSFVVTGFARRDTLAHWFPQIYDDEHNSWRIWLSKRSQALLLHIGIIGAVFIVNLGLTLWGTIHYPNRQGVTTIYQGSCGTVKRLDQ